MLSKIFGRKDGIPLEDKLSRGRKFMPYILGGAPDSWVLWEEKIKIEAAEAFIKKWNEEHPPELRLTMHLLLLYACAKAHMMHPRMNKFIAGKRYYQRKGMYLSFSAKKEMSSHGGLLIFKRLFLHDESLEDVIIDIRKKLTKDRTDDISGQEKETLDLLKLPRPLLMAGMTGVKVLDFFNLLPDSFIEHNPMFASMFISNLGSMGLNSGFHHLYDFGNVSLFGVMGAPSEEPVVEDGQVVARRIASLKWTFDERIEDGFNAARAAGAVTNFLENPETLL